tara:strand:- start:1013 stop:1237 length:225 start_codon:yes stop_codon:yes gene_type:complete
LEELGRHREVWGLSQHEKIDTSRMVEAGATTIATATYTIIEKRTVMRRSGEEIMPHFRNLSTGARLCAHAVTPA